MNYFQGILRGAHLLAHTWASRPTLIGMFCDWPMADSSFVLKYRHYNMKYAVRR